jgi:hypothetical protein
MGNSNGGCEWLEPCCGCAANEVCKTGGPAEGLPGGIKGELVLSTGGETLAAAPTWFFKLVNTVLCVPVGRLPRLIMGAAATLFLGDIFCLDLGLCCVMNVVDVVGLDDCAVDEVVAGKRVG